MNLRPRNGYQCRDTAARPPTYTEAPRIYATKSLLDFFFFSRTLLLSDALASVLDGEFLAPLTAAYSK